MYRYFRFRTGTSKYEVALLPYYEVTLFCISGFLPLLKSAFEMTAPEIRRIFIHKTATMDSILVALARGYAEHVAGQVAPEHALILVEKFQRLYGTEWSASRRSRRKASGLGNARLFVHPPYASSMFDWWLLLSPGDHPARDRERPIRDSREARQRLIFQGQYEAVRLPASKATPPREGPVTKKGAAKTPKTSAPWTYRMTPEEFEYWQVRIQDAIQLRKNVRELRSLALTLNRLPGFRGIRSQTVELMAFARSEWRRIKSTPFDELNLRKR